MIIFKEFITRNYIKLNTSKYFVFGDNDMRIGFGGQAKEIRGEPNSIGIRVKKGPGIEPSCYYYDSEYEDNIKKIEEDFQVVEKLLKQGRTVVFPSAGIGTGLGKLKDNAPKTLKYINNRIYGFYVEYGE